MDQTPKSDKHLDIVEIFNACCQGIKNSSNKTRINGYLNFYLFNTENYDRLASIGEYEKIKNLEKSICDLDFDEKQLQEDFAKLYKNQLQRINGPARKYYDRIKKSRERCPYCEKPRIEELDHFLPQATHAIFSIFPKNLIPCCKNCNKNKFTKILQLHPYYDNIHQYRWLFARIVDDKNGSTFRFYAEPPSNLDRDFRNKILKYFDDLKLAQVYAEDSISELVEAKELSGLNLTDIQLKEELKHWFGNYDSKITNHWKRAVCECIDQANSKSISRLLDPI